jgi:hypothetical protein
MKISSFLLFLDLFCDIIYYIFNKEKVYKMHTNIQDLLNEIDCLRKPTQHNISRLIEIYADNCDIEEAQEICTAIDEKFNSYNGLCLIDNSILLDIALDEEKSDTERASAIHHASPTIETFSAFLPIMERKDTLDLSEKIIDKALSSGDTGLAMLIMYLEDINFSEDMLEQIGRRPDDLEIFVKMACSSSKPAVINKLFDQIYLDDDNSEGIKQLIDVIDDPKNDIKVKESAAEHLAFASRESLIPVTRKLNALYDRVEEASLCRLLQEITFELPDPETINYSGEHGIAAYITQVE